MTRREWMKAAMLSAVGAGAAGVAIAPGAAEAANLRLRNRLFVMDTWFWQVQMPHEEQVALLAELGVPGMLLSGAGRVTDDALRVLDDHNVTLEAVYYTAHAEDEPSEALLEVIKRLEGRGTLVALAMHSREFSPSDQRGDASARRQIDVYAQAARDAGLTLAFYPHAGFWLERVADGVRLARQLDRSHVGAMFNLYHWLARDAREVSLEETLAEAVPFLKGVTINGARTDTAEISAEEAILPLDEGDYDLRPVLRELVRRGYAGPIGLQGYGIGGDVPARLERSVGRYRAFREGL